MVILQQKRVTAMRITIKQLKGLIREAMEQTTQQPDSDYDEKEDLYSTYSDMYKSMYGIRPRWLSFDAAKVEDLRDMVAKLEQDFTAELKVREEEAKRAEEYYQELQNKREEETKSAAELAAMGAPAGHEHLEDLPSKSGMGRRITESLKTAVREALKGDQTDLDVAKPKGKLTAADFKKLGKKKQTK